MYRLKFTIPFLVLFILLGMLWYELFFAKPHDIPSPLIGEAVPQFVLPTVGGNGTFSSHDLNGHVSIVNVFSSWCYACTLEAEMLMQIKNNYKVAIYGINYKDRLEDVTSWLKKYGNPYIKIGDDKSGDVAIDFGVYGTPETFIVSKQGKIVYRHIGAIDEKAWKEILYPKVKEYERS